jgi:lysozyme
MITVNKNTLDLIKNFEGFINHSYLDAVGLPTIGIGHLILKGEEFPDTITREEAEDLLQKDLQKAINGVLRLITVSLSDNQFGALVSFAFNCGNGALQRSTLRQKVNRYELDEVPLELLKWCRAGGKVLKGLVKRRTAEGLLFLS